MPRLLDLFCCEGGAGMGYHRAGFEVVGVDIKNQHRYPFEFVQADAIEYVLEHGHEFDAIHASPPCQAYSITKHGHSVQYPELVEPTRAALVASGKPFIIENVVGAPLLDPLKLCWSMFHEPGSVLDDDGTPLRMQRHRLFESNVALLAPRPCRHPKMQVAGSYGGARRDKVEARTIRKGGYVPSRAVQQRLLGIDWATEKGMHESLPPVYTEHLGAQLLAAMEAGADR
ncbi:DNA cytosine methyltransferase [Agrococcus jejuensis]|uniref:DNA cytosine methyltransferase n=1 Tax=Agrococcus jejuensis TaxID=399736 RepID=UPI0011A809C2|nr:DNA cytosine methyltransferase [Agrococcus jejuensis]